MAIAVAVIVLSAGASSRMGRPKALLEVADGVTFAEMIVRTTRAAGAGEIRFVLGPPDGEAIRARLPAGCEVTWNAEPGRGMLSSIQAGVAALHNEVAAALIWPVDQPLVTEVTVRRVIEAEAERIVMPRHGGRGGHPVRIPRSLFGALSSLAIDRGLRGLIEDHPARVLRIEVADSGAVEDVDTPEDYALRVEKRGR